TVLQKGDCPPTPLDLFASAWIGRVSIVVIGDSGRLFEISVQILIRDGIGRRRRKDGYRGGRHARLVLLGKMVLRHRRNWNQECAQFRLLSLKQTHRDPEQCL